MEKLLYGQLTTYYYQLLYYFTIMLLLLDDIYNSTLQCLPDDSMFIVSINDRGSTTLNNKCGAWHAPQNQIVPSLAAVSLCQ